MAPTRDLCPSEAPAGGQAGYPIALKMAISTYVWATESRCVSAQGVLAQDKNTQKGQLVFSVSIGQIMLHILCNAKLEDTPHGP